MVLDATMSTNQGDVQWFYTIQAAFPDEEMQKRIWTEAHRPSQLPRLFEDISRYVLSIKQDQQNHPRLQDQELPTNPKKRKLEDGSAQTNGVVTVDIASPVIAFECPDVSVQIPARKKLRIQIVGDAGDAQRNELRLLNPTTNEIEYAVAAQNIDQVFCLPVPDKQQRQSYIAIFAKPGAIGVEPEQILFTLTETSPPTLASSTLDTVTADDTYVTATQQAFTRLLQHYGKSVTVPSASEFASARPQSHRKGEKGYHVNAHRGSKEGIRSPHSFSKPYTTNIRSGYLFFLPTGILFGFKKPLAFYPFHIIESISYTSVLQRTFNLVIASRDNSAASSGAGEAGEAEVKETEFSMLDQEDFQGIDEYVKRHGLNDASLAAGRRAKEYGVNKEKKGVNGAADEMPAGSGAALSLDAGEVDGMRTEQELQDLEDEEEEEDYEASGGESDGEGEDSEEDEDGVGEEYDDGGDGEEDAEGEGVEDEDEI